MLFPWGENVSRGRRDKRLLVRRLGVRPRVCSPTAEATDLKSVKCGFESRHTQIAQINPNNLNKQKVRIE